MAAQIPADILTRAAEVVAAAFDEAFHPEDPDEPPGIDFTIMGEKILVTRLAQWVAEERASLRGLVVMNGDASLYRTMNQGCIEWTANVEKALRFARRQDAEMFCAEDEDAWIVREAPPPAGTGEER